MRVGLITYHAAYNFGSVLQAYATQEIVKRISGNCEIINYRTNEQKRVYDIFVWNKGRRVLKSLIKNLLVLPHIFSKKERAKGYERTIEKLFNLSPECNEPDDVYAMWDKYDIIISGSDQIWNKHSNELHDVSWDYMMPYLLKDFCGKKVSYASSFPCMNKAEIGKIGSYINRFSYISVRERYLVEVLSTVCSVPVSNVLDPTLLFDKGEWIDKLGLKVDNSEKYVLYYALNKWNDLHKSIKEVVRYAKMRNINVKMISPLFPVISRPGLEVLQCVTPIGFLNLILNADTVITDSYHGTIFSINFEKEMYSINGANESDIRKTDILSRVGLQDRIIKSASDMCGKMFTKIDYKIVRKKLEAQRKTSVEYLEKALKYDKQNKQENFIN